MPYVPQSYLKRGLYTRVLKPATETEEAVTEVVRLNCYTKEYEVVR